jgi:peptide/nickel transport system substrate-binding protein
MMNLDPEKTELFQDKAVRQALLMALDRNSITQNIYLGFGEPAVGAQPPISPAYAPDQMTPSLDYSTQGALDLFASAGWKDTNGDGWLDRGGMKMKFKLTYVTGDSTTDQLVSYIKEAWKAVGVDVELNGVGGDIYNQELKDSNFDMILVGASLGGDFSETGFFACDQYENGFNYMKYCNPEWDTLDEQQKREFDPAARNQLLIEQSQIIWEDQPMGIIRFGIYRTGYADTLHNFYPNGYGFLWSLPYMWIE